MSQELYDREREYIKNIARDIRALAAYSEFDHRKFISKSWLEAKPVHGDDIEVSQGRLIHAIGKVLKPKNVYEVGIGPGITAHSLVSACPGLNYYGVDNAPHTYFDTDFDIGRCVSDTFNSIVARCVACGGGAVWREVDSDKLHSFVHPFGHIDLIHIDGDHSFEHQRRDVDKAIASGAEWVLVDDCNDTEVVTACFAAWRDQLHKSWRGGLLPMIYFEDSRTGSFLFHNGMWRNERTFR